MASKQDEGVERSLGFETRSVHAGYSSTDHADSANVPIYATAAFGLGDADCADAIVTGEADGYSYSRAANPTVTVLERRIADLEGGVGAVAVGSGMAAVTFALVCAAEGGGRVIAPADIYGGTVDLLETFLPQFGIHADFVDDINDLDAVEALIGPDTKVVFAETVANPSLVLADVPGLASVAHRHGVALIVDNTLPTPVLFRPIEHGADIVVHSVTKGLGGHGNVLGGAVVDAGRFDWANGRYPQFIRVEQVISEDREDEWRSFASAYGTEAFHHAIRIKYLRNFGATLSPFNAYLQLQGIDTLTERIRREVISAATIAEHLRWSPYVDEVFAPGTGFAAGSDRRAQRQRELLDELFPNGASTVLSFRPKGGVAQARRLVGSTQVFSYIPNVGDVRSMIVNPALVTHREVGASHRRGTGLSDDLIRLSIGLENVEDLVSDLDHALEVSV